MKTATSFEYSHHLVVGILMVTLFHPAASTSSPPTTDSLSTHHQGSSAITTKSPLLNITENALLKLQNRTMVPTVERDAMTTTASNSALPHTLALPIIWNDSVISPNVASKLLLNRTMATSTTATNWTPNAAYHQRGNITMVTGLSTNGALSIDGFGDTTNLIKEGDSNSPSLTEPLHPTLDKSFSTKQYWVIMELAIATDTDIQDGVYLRNLEASLAESYSIAKKREIAEEEDRSRLLQGIDPDGDKMMRKRRASTVEGSTARIIDLSRSTEVPTTAELVFYISSEGTNIPATECAMTYAKLSLQELTLLMGIVVLSPVASYNEVPTLTLPSDGTSPTLLLATLVPLAVVLACMCCCCICCVCCGPKRKVNERVMTPDTFRRLEFKQKFPYKPYTPRQTRVDEMEQTAGDIEEAKRESLHEDDLMDTTPKTQDSLGQWTDDCWHSVREWIRRRLGARNQWALAQSKAGALDRSSSNILPGLSGDDSELPRYSDLEPVTNQGLDTSLRASEPHGTSFLSSTQKDATRHLPQIPITSKVRGGDYRKEQQEISRVLEPETTTKPVRKKRKKVSGGHSSTKQRRKDASSPATGQEKQAESDQLSETKQRVHDLIEEAFSLVKLKATPTTHVTVFQEVPGANHNTRGESPGHQTTPTLGDSIKEHCPMKESGVQTMDFETDNKVVIVSMDTLSTNGAAAIWSPYNARDDLEKIAATREPTSLPGGVDETTSLSLYSLSHPYTPSRPYCPDGAEYSVTELGNDDSLDQSMRSDEYASRSFPGTKSNAIGLSHLETTNRNAEQLRTDNFGDLRNLTAFERERSNRTGDYYDEHDGTDVIYRERPSKSLLDTIKAEYAGSSTRMQADNQKSSNW